MKFIHTLKSRDGKPIEYEKLYPQIKRVCNKHQIALLYLFGSYARNSAYHLSDLDIAFYSVSPFTPKEVLKFLGELQDLFEEEAIDLVDLRKAPLPLIHSILKHGKLLFARDLKIRIALEMRWESHYWDTEPLRRAHFNFLKRRLVNGTFGNRKG
ncbi:hypothetical protein DRP53_07080 [candidate division WOR-3 bacterium]|uniref:Polymerase beta nucleotidyltransferase domain-containing protein n=1 Tax=candidate division WOR-3 bacterium TaxID=2052148 RepID=A0A660SIG1_UNCW3|nr:MAG: hypothetical protein DRP53_07080 [candidate division WOR-3 bacterium]